MGHRVWRVTGWNSLEKVYERRFPLNDFSEGQMTQMLVRFVAKLMTFDEIAAHCRKRRKGEARGEFEAIVASGGSNSISVGTNPYFVAEVEGVN
jgi:hypothetical protein